MGNPTSPTTTVSEIKSVSGNEIIVVITLWLNAEVVSLLRDEMAVFPNGVVRFRLLVRSRVREVAVVTRYERNGNTIRVYAAMVICVVTASAALREN